MSLTLFDRAGPFASLPSRPWEPDRGLRDHTAEREARLAESCDCPWDEWELSQIKAWRARLAAGDNELRLGEWWEGMIELGDGAIVAVVAMSPWGPPAETELGWIDGHAEFYGDISPTGYFSLFFRLDDVGNDYRQFLVCAAEQHRRESIEAWGRKRRPRRRRLGRRLKANQG